MVGTSDRCVRRWSVGSLWTRRTISKTRGTCLTSSQSLVASLTYLSPSSTYVLLLTYSMTLASVCYFSGYANILISCFETSDLISVYISQVLLASIGLP